jgi:hypothetical protein
MARPKSLRAELSERRAMSESGAPPRSGRNERLTPAHFRHRCCGWRTARPVALGYYALSVGFRAKGRTRELQVNQGSMSVEAESHLDDPARDAAQLLIRLAFLALFVGAPVAAAGSRRLIFVLMPIGASLILAAGALDAPAGALRRARKLFTNPVALAILAVLVWAGLSLAWTPFLAAASERFLKTLGTIGLATAAATLLPTRTKTSNLYLIPIGVLLAAAATGAALWFLPEAAPVADVEGSAVDRSALGLIILLWPTLGAISARQHWLYGGLVAIAVAVTTIAVWTPGGMLALGLGALAAVTATSNPRRAGLIWGCLFAFLFVAAPAIVIGAQAAHLDALLGHGDAAGRFALAAELLREQGLRLVTGHGFDTFGRSIASGYLTAATPRTALLEIWYELGVLGALAMAALALRVFVDAGRHPPPIAAFHVGGLVSVAVIALTGESTFQLWWITLVSIAGVAFASAARAQYRSERPGVVIAAQRPTAAA